MAVKDLADLKAVYLIFGTEDLLLDRAVARLRRRLQDVADLDFNMEVFDGASATADDIVNAANTMPFMSEKRLVIVRDADKLAAGDLASLAAYAADPAPYTCLVLVARKMSRATKLFKAVDALGGAFEYVAPKRGEYAGEVGKMFAEHGKRITREAAQALVDGVGRDLRRLDGEVDKIVAYLGQREDVTAADVARVASGGAPTSVFDFVDAVGSRDVRSALRLLGRLTDSGESPVGVLAMAVRHVRSLIGARALMDRGARSDEMAPALGVAPWQVRNLVAQAGGFTSAELARALRLAADAEADMKTSRADARLVLERWIVSVCRGS